MDIIIRSYEDKDYDAVSKIIFDSFGLKKSFCSSPSIYEFVSVIDNQVVGYFNLLEAKDIVLDIIEYHIGYVCVDIKYRGVGIGSKMMDFILKFAKENNISRLELTSGNNRIAAHKLYEKYGFIKRDTTVFRRELL